MLVYNTSVGIIQILISFKILAWLAYKSIAVGLWYGGDVFAGSGSLCVVKVMSKTLARRIRNASDGHAPLLVLKFLPSFLRLLDCGSHIQTNTGRKKLT